MTYYLAFYYDGTRWRLVTRELHTDKKYVERKAQPYKKSGYRVELKTFNLT